MSKLKELPIIACAIIALLIPTFTNTAEAAFLDGFKTVDDVKETSGVTTGDDPVEFITDIIKVILTIVGIVAVAAVVYGGVTYIIALGDEAKTKQAKMIILYSVIGLLVIGVSAILVNVVINIYAT